MKKKSTAEYAETAELFIGKDRNTNHFMETDSPSPFDPPGMKIRGCTKRRQRAQRSSLERPLFFSLPGSVGNGDAFPPASRP
jgi:hypothetical protein